MSDVCLLLEGRYPGDGGVSTWVDGLVRQLPQLTFTVATFRHPGCRGESVGTRPGNVEEIRVIDLPGDLEVEFLPPGDITALAAAVPAASVHHVLSVGAASRATAAALAERGQSFLLTEHGIAWRELAVGQRDGDPPGARARRAAAARRAATEAYAAADLVTSVSASGRDSQLALGAAPERSWHIPNPAPDPPRQRPPARERGSGPLVGLVGRVVRLKDVATFVRAAALVGAELPAARFAVVGTLHEDADYAARCQELAVGLGLDSRLEFVGADDPWAWYPSLDVVVLTSRSEAAPLVLLEALSCGRPVVGTAAGDVPRLLERSGMGASVVPIGDARGVARAVLAALRDAERAEVASGAPPHVLAGLPRERAHAVTYERLYARLADGTLAGAGRIRR